MATKKPQREVVEEIIRNLVQSEITGIQTVAKDMAERVKKLEEHSVKIKKYADEIERLAADAASERYDKASLDELVMHLEKTLTKLRKRQSEGEPKTEIAKSKSTTVVVPETRKVAVAEKPVPPPVAPKEEKVEKEEILNQIAPVRKVTVYTTPEGFVVRKIRI